jgi:hypothetical protein
VDAFTAPVPDTVCLGCHGRQKAEIMALRLPDVHRDAAEPLGCMDCHSADEMHGDGTRYASLLEEGAMDVACEDCHVAADLTPRFHRRHAATVACAACHVSTVIACQSCHFETQVNDQQKVHYGIHKGFKLLMQHRGKVTTATYQSVTYSGPCEKRGRKGCLDGETFYVIAPFQSHAVTSGATVTCGDCHLAPGAGGGAPGNAALIEYLESGGERMTVSAWDHELGAMVPAQGVIPVPPNWQTALKFSYATRENDGWAWLSDETALNQMPFGLPLSEAQMDALLLGGQSD